MRLSQWILTAGLCVMAVPAAAQTKVAVVDFQTALLQTADMQKQAADLEARYKDRQDEIAKLSKELEEIQTKLQSTTDQAALAALQADGQRKQRRAQRLSEDLQSDVEFDRQNILQSAGGKMREIVQQLRIDQAVDVIVDVGGVLASDPAIDLTKAATEAYDAKYPVS